MGRFIDDDFRRLQVIGSFSCQPFVIHDDCVLTAERELFVITLEVYYLDPLSSQCNKTQRMASVYQLSLLTLTCVFFRFSFPSDRELNVIGEVHLEMYCNQVNDFVIELILLPV